MLFVSGMMQKEEGNHSLSLTLCIVFSGPVGLCSLMYPCFWVSQPFGHPPSPSGGMERPGQTSTRHSSSLGNGAAPSTCGNACSKAGDCSLPSTLTAQNLWSECTAHRLAEFLLFLTQCLVLARHLLSYNTIPVGSHHVLGCFTAL